VIKGIPERAGNAPPSQLHRVTEKVSKPSGMPRADGLVHGESKILEFDAQKPK
jgi:hypothetical protein